MFERNAKLINKKFYQYLIPSIITIFALQFSSLLDGIIVGNMIGVEALTASGLVLPIIYFIQTPGVALGVGGSIVVGNLLGKRDLKTANKAFSACLIYNFIVSLIFALLGPILALPLAKMFSSDPNLIELGRQYLLMYFVTDPIITFTLMIASFMAIDNNPRLSAILYIVSNVVKVGSMFLFINVFGWGLYGAALSTGFGCLISCVCLIFYAKSNKRLLKPTLKLKKSFVDFKDSVKASSATALSMILLAIQMSIVNVFLGQLVTDSNDLLIYGLLANMVFIFDLFAGGVQGVIPTICTILYGEKDYYSLKSVVKKIYLINLGFTILITALIMIAPNVYATVYNYQETDPALVERAYYIIRIYLLSFIPYELNKFSTNYYPSIEKNMPSYVTVILREAVVVLPLTIVLLHTNGLFGYALAQVINEAAVVFITYIFTIIYGKKRHKGYGIFLFEKEKFASYDVSFDNNIDNAAIISEELTDFALKNKASNRNAQIIGLASEEIVSNIIYYGYKNKKQNFIDVNLKISEGKMILRIRDDGLPFDPSKYGFDEDDNYSTNGIKMIEKLTDKMTYMRVLNMNNTTFEMKL